MAVCLRGRFSEALVQLDRLWDELFPAEQARIVHPPRIVLFQRLIGERVRVVRRFASDVIQLAHGDRRPIGGAIERTRARPRALCAVTAQPHSLRSTRTVPRGTGGVAIS